MLSMPESTGVLIAPRGYKNLLRTQKDGNGSLRNTKQPRNPIPSFLLLSDYLGQLTTITENDDIEGKGKIGPPTGPLLSSPFLFNSRRNKLVVECVHLKMEIKTVELVLGSVPTIWVRTKHIRIHEL